MTAAVDFCPACRWTDDARPGRYECPECDTHWPLRRGVSREYAALGWTPGALSHDFGGRDRGGPLDPYTDASDSQRPASKRRPACVWPPRWRDVAREIMRLPVTVRDEPAAVSGEIAA